MKQKISKKQREKEEYNKWLKSLEAMAPKFARQQYAPAPKKQMLEYKLTRPAGRPTADAPSMVTAGGSTAKAADKRYTGTAMLGVGMLHKSNLVPVFESDDAKAIASMRR